MTQNLVEELESMEPQQPEAEPSPAEVAAVIAGLFSETLGVLVGRRNRAYADTVARLDKERAELEQEADCIASAARGLVELLPARVRVAQAEHDRLLLAGDREGAALKLAEQHDAEQAPIRMEARRGGIAARIEAIEAEKRAIAHRVFGEWYGEVQQVVRAAEHGLFIVLLNGLQQSFWNFQTLTDTAPKAIGERGLFGDGHLTSLTADENSPEWLAGQHWYRGRR